ncbi:MAG: hypothetical protein M1831_005421 [Alyxoria varia]|nr:MAG: hypothetical protein M1831_005421 [Alyxoria varia]
MSQEFKHMSTWTYDLLLWVFSIVVDLFFREVHPRSSWKIPRTGPVLFVGAPHANQFVDPLILMRVVKTEARRRISILIAEKSMKRKFIGFAARLAGALSVGRALDKTKPVPGRICLPDPENDPLLIRGIDTNFQSEDFQVGGLIVLPTVNNAAANSEIAEILGPTELRVKKAFKGDVAMEQLTGRSKFGQPALDSNGGNAGHPGEYGHYPGIRFKAAPKVDQTKVYDTVFSQISRGGCIGIYPEGGSHDRTELLPLKAGVAIMALGAMAENPNCNLKIVPCGMNYFHAHKFRSRAVIEFGTPLEVPQELVEEFKSGSRREAIGRMLEMIYDSLVAVTVTSPDYDTLMLIQAVRRLYNPKGKKLPLPMVVELNRRLVKGYTHYRDDPRIIDLKKGILKYNKQLMALNVRDHQLAYAKFSILHVVGMLLYRLGKLMVLSAGVLPGLILFAPIFVAGKAISMKKSREALAASTVKIQARDVMATWKLLVSLALAPTLYTLYTIILAFWTYYNRVQGIVPPGVPLWTMFVAGFVFFPAITFAALRFGEIGMDIAKSLRPLVLALLPSSGNTLVKLRKWREELAHQVTALINQLGPEIFPDFDAQRIIATSEGHRTPPSPGRGRSLDEKYRIGSRETSPAAQFSLTRASIGGGSSMAGNLPRNESFKNLGHFGFFASRPTTPTSSHSRAASRSRPGSSGGFTSMKPLSTLDSHGAADDVTKRIRGAMKERGQRRLSLEPDGSHAGDGDSDASSDAEDESQGVGVEMKKNV